MYKQQVENLSRITLTVTRHPNLSRSAKSIPLLDLSVFGMAGI